MLYKEEQIFQQCCRPGRKRPGRAKSGVGFGRLFVGCSVDVEAPALAFLHGLQERFDGGRIVDQHLVHGGRRRDGDRDVGQGQVGVDAFVGHQRSNQNLGRVGQLDFFDDAVEDVDITIDDTDLAIADFAHGRVQDDAGGDDRGFGIEIEQSDEQGLVIGRQNHDVVEQDGLHDMFAFATHGNHELPLIEAGRQRQNLEFGRHVHVSKQSADGGRGEMADCGFHAGTPIYMDLPWSDCVEITFRNKKALHGQSRL